MGLPAVSLPWTLSRRWRGDWACLPESHTTRSVEQGAQVDQVPEGAVRQEGQYSGSILRSPVQEGAESQEIGSPWEGAGVPRCP